MEIQDKDRKIKLIRDHVDKSKKLSQRRPHFSKDMKASVVTLLHSGIAGACAGRTREENF